MEPQIQYCTTEDGASIAYATMGAGPVVIMLPNVHSFAGRMRLLPFHKAFCEAVAAGFTLVQYDGRGMGLSTRERTEYGLEARLRDLDAVVVAIGAETFSLCGQLHGGFAAMAHTARHPDRVSRLVLIDALSSGERYFTETPAGRINAALGPVTTDQWEYVSEALYGPALRGRFLDAGRDTVRDALGAVVQETWTPSAFLAHRQALRDIDVSGKLAAIAVPTLVISTYTAPEMSRFFEVTRELASAIPKARLLRVTPRWAGWEDRDLETLVTFLSDGTQPAETAARVSATTASGMAVILFTDIVDSTALTERLGDTTFRTTARALDERLRAAICDAGGTPVEGKVLGDGVMAVFTSAAQAIAAARRCIELSAESELRLHVGLHAGDVIREAGNVYGGTVNIASRICGLSAPGEVLVSDIVRGLARTSGGVAFEDRGQHDLKGIAEPQRVFAVRPQ